MNEILPHPPYSPAPSPADYHFFKHLDHLPSQEAFANQATVGNAVKEFIDTRTPNFCTNGIAKLGTKWKRCVYSNGSYFDG